MWELSGVAGLRAFDKQPNWFNQVVAKRQEGREKSWEIFVCTPTSRLVVVALLFFTFIHLFPHCTLSSSLLYWQCAEWI